LVVVILLELCTSSETQTLRALRINAEPNIFAPPQTPFPGAQDGQNLISWSLPLLQTQFGEDWFMQIRVIVVTDPHTNNARPPARCKHTDRTENNTLRL